MSGVISASSLPRISSNLQLKPQIKRFQSTSIVPIKQFHGGFTRFERDLRWCEKSGTICNCSVGPGGPNSGGNENKSVLDAFFLGKALAETLNERIESAVGEFLSAVGRLQAEQQKQVQDLQEEVLERAKKAKEKAARKAKDTQGSIPKSTTIVIPVDDVGASTVVPSSTVDKATPGNPPSSPSAPTKTIVDSDPPIEED